MTNLLNKSNHPVEVKKVKVRIWTLRSEIEAAVAKRVESKGSEDSLTVDIEDIKTFYHNHIPAEVEEDLAAEETEGEESEVTKLTDEALSEDTKSDDDKTTESEKEKFERVIPEEKYISHGEVLLSDLHMDRVMLFTNEKFVQGQNIIIQFLITSPFVVSGEVQKVIHFARNSKIIKETRLDHRVQFGCSLMFPSERTNLRDFLKSIEPDIPTPPKKLKTQDDSEDDDFDDLGL